MQNTHAGKTHDKKCNNIDRLNYTVKIDCAVIAIQNKDGIDKIKKRFELCIIITSRTLCKVADIKISSKIYFVTNDNWKDIENEISGKSGENLDRF